MKVFIAILFLFPFISYAQEIEQFSDSLTHQNDIVMEEVRETSTEIEQITDTLSHPLDEVKQFADTVEQISALGGLTQEKINTVKIKCSICVTISASK